LSSTLITITVTDSNGNYLFQNLIPDFYYAKFTIPTGFQFSPPYVGTNPNLYNDTFPVNGESNPLDFTSGMVYLDLDAGVGRI